MYEFGFIMGVLAIIGALLIYKYRVAIWAWLKKTAAQIKNRVIARSAATKQSDGE